MFIIEFDDKFTENEKNDLSIFHLNVRSIRRNGDELVCYLETLKYSFDVICLTETWISNLPVVNVLFPDYLGFHSIRSSRTRGGVAIYVNRKLKVKNLPINSINEPYAGLFLSRSLH